MFAQEVGIFVAFSAGVLSFFSPCVIPLVPAYLTFLAGTELKAASKKTVFIKALGFVLGFSIIFILLGASASFLGSFFLDYRDIVRRVGGLIIIFFGIQLTDILPFNIFKKEGSSFNMPNFYGDSWLISILMGGAFAVGWTPCVGPVLASILMYAGLSSEVTYGIILLSVYSLGLMIPFLIAALAIDKISILTNKYKKVTDVLPVIGGIILTLFGLMVFFDRLDILL